MLDKVFEQRIGQPLLVGPFRITEDPVKRIRVGLLNLTHSPLQGCADIAGLGTYVVPMTVFGDLEAVGFGEPSQLFIAGVIDDLLVFLVPDIADTFEKQQWEDVSLEVSRIHRAAQDVGRFPEVGFDLRQSNHT